MPSTAAAGAGKVTITSGGVSVTGTVNIATAYPGIFKAGADSLAAAQTLTVVGGKQTSGSAVTTNAAGQFVPALIDLSSGLVYLTIYGTGIGTSAVTATIGGANATVAYSGPQGTYPGLDQLNLLIPASLAGKGQVNVIVTAGGKPSSPVYVVIQ
jgi:uncharacterized protein (TIGR03437 family)